MQITSVGKIINGEFVPQYRTRAEELSKLKDGQWVQEIIKPIKPSKTKAQLGYYYGVIIPAVKRDFDDRGEDFYGVPITKDQIDQLLKEKCGFGRSKAKMNIDECSEFITRVINFCNEKLHCEIPEARRE